MRRILLIIAGTALALVPARIASAFTVYSGTADSQAAMSHSMMFGGHNDGVRQLGSGPAARGDARSTVVSQGVIAPDWFFKNRRR